jgi:hypothetical protein
MKNIGITLLAILSIQAAADEFYKGENLITPYELDNDKWEILKKEDGPFKSMMWRSIKKGMADAYVVNIQSGNKSNLKRVRKIQDDPGRKACESFESIDLEGIPNKNYKSQLWRTVCVNGANFKAQILQLAIRGKDSMYHLQKIWRGSTSDAEIKEWIENFRRVYVCDTREKNKQCPSGYSKVKDV